LRVPKKKLKYCYQIVINKQKGFMGAGTGGGLYNSAPTLQANMQKFANKYGLNSHSGMFGVKGTGSARVILSHDPAKTAKAFFQDLSSGGKTTAIIGGVNQSSKGHKVTVFIDGSSLYYRPVSKSGSPSVNIQTPGPRGKNYKIHFEFSSDDRK
jgi:hypothetical protein